MSTNAVPSDGVFLRACQGQSVPYVPIWFMRQAGRSLPEYRAARDGIEMLDACTRPDLVAEITMQPVRRHGVDAAILFSDIVLPLKAIGVDLDIVPGTGPVVADSFASMADVARLRPLEPDDMPYITEAVRALVDELGQTPLIGFAGAPFTLASYLIEGGPSRDHAKTKALMRTAPEVWHALLSRLAGVSAAFLRLQIDAGARAVQLFDSWAGALSAADYRTYAQPHSTRVLGAVSDVPRIHFGVGTGELLPLMAAAGADVVGVDWRVPLDKASERLGGRHVVQGNLDPTVMMAPTEVVESEACRVLAAGRAAAGHVFNLGHGVLPSTDPDALTRLVEFVHAQQAG